MNILNLNKFSVFSWLGQLISLNILLIVLFRNIDRDHFLAVANISDSLG